jgi:inner membrane transporter RhtA
LLKPWFGCSHAHRLLPATACVIGVVVLGQVPAPIELAGIALVIGGVALHRPEPA